MPQPLLPTGPTPCLKKQPFCKQQNRTKTKRPKTSNHLHINIATARILPQHRLCVQRSSYGHCAERQTESWIMRTRRKQSNSAHVITDLDIPQFTHSTAFAGKGQVSTLVTAGVWSWIILSFQFNLVISGNFCCICFHAFLCLGFFCLVNFLIFPYHCGRMLTVFLGVFGGLGVTVDRKTTQIQSGFSLNPIYILIDKQAHKKCFPKEEKHRLSIVTFWWRFLVCKLIGSPAMPRLLFPVVCPPGLGRVDRWCCYSVLSHLLRMRRNDTKRLYFTACSAVSEKE